MYFIFVLLFLCSSCYCKREFYVDWENDRFVKDGETFQYVSGGMHYFRIPHQYWEQRIVAAKSAGLNAVQTYVAWNAHEPQPGVYNFEGDLDIVKFIKLAQTHDMALILRVGPYICAEWNFGGLPPWLLGKAGIQVRTLDLDYMRSVNHWIHVLAQVINPLLYSNGGPVVMIQVENEYGSFGCDHEYIKILYELFQNAFGEDVVYFSTDGPGGYKCGSLQNTTILTTIDFGVGADAAANFAKLKKFQPHGPFVNSEFYTGWLDHWKHKHSIRPAQSLGVSLDKLIALDASVNFYMWHGGTNFGLSSGAQRTSLMTNPTSYDYDAPQSEWGDVKLDKYWAIRNVTEKYFPGNKLPVPKNSKKLGGIILHPELQGLLTDQIGAHSLIKRYPLPHTMEQLGVFEGIVAYQHEVTDQKPLVNVVLQVLGVHDRAYVLVDGKFVQVVRRDEDDVKVTVSAYKTITILAENMGYIGFSKAMLDYNAEYKGIKNVTVNGCIWTMWNHYRINVTAGTAPQREAASVARPREELTSKRSEWNGRELLPNGPAMFTDKFTLDKTQLLDTFINITESWSKGYLMVNDILIGRYWPDAGPQFTLYIPGVWLREGPNTVTLIELQSYNPTTSASVYLTDTPYIDGPVNPNA